MVDLKVKERSLYFAVKLVGERSDVGGGTSLHTFAFGIAGTYQPVVLQAEKYREQAQYCYQ